jgi:hypothetical protein
MLFLMRHIRLAMATRIFSTGNASPDPSLFGEKFPVPVPRHRGRIFPRSKPVGEQGPDGDPHRGL